MAVPKYRISKSKRGMRRSHLAQKNPPVSLAKCSRCGEAKLPHRVCIHCGYYRDQEVICMDKA